MSKNTEDLEDQKHTVREDPQQFGTNVPMPDLNPSAPKKPGPFDAPDRPEKKKNAT
jgi:hypothetical protein